MRHFCIILFITLSTLNFNLYYQQYFYLHVQKYFNVLLFKLNKLQLSERELISAKVSALYNTSSHLGYNYCYNKEKIIRSSNKLVASFGIVYRRCGRVEGGGGR